jgi:signal transduction histidine kinase
MLDRLHTAITEQRRFTADASHELRTPLAIMQTEIDVALRSPQTPDGSRPVLASIGEEIARTRRIVESLLTLARADEDRLVVASGPVDLREVARSVHDRLRPSAEAKGSALALDVPSEPAVVSGDEVRLDQLLTNLIDNAITYTPAGGTIDVRVDAGNGFVRAEVADDGPGIPAADVPHVFERFHRVDKARTRAGGGAGLGLAICRSIARAHGGDVEVRSTAGAGSVFTVRLPARAGDL